MAMQSEQGDNFTNDLQLSAWWLITFLSCLRHFTKLFTKYSEMSLILPQVINWFWNYPYLIIKVLYDLQRHTRWWKRQSLCSLLKLTFHSLQQTATILKSQRLCFFWPSLVESQVCQLNGSIGRSFWDFVVFLNDILQMLAENWQQTPKELNQEQKQTY